jgi:deoxyadenosine/deoxycytidine kinase
MERVPAVFVVGEIGAGKSTLLAGLAPALAAALDARGIKRSFIKVPEPTAEWEQDGALEFFYTNKEDAARGCMFQMYAFATRVRATQSVLAARAPGAHPEVALVERDIVSDQIFGMAQPFADDPAMFAMYKRMVVPWETVYPLTPAVYIYVKPPLAACADRVRARARASEMGGGDAPAISADYQRLLRALHEYVYQGVAPAAGSRAAAVASRLPRVAGGAAAVIVVGGDTDFRDPAQIGALAKKVAAAPGWSFWR